MLLRGAPAWLMVGVGFVLLFTRECQAQTPAKLSGPLSATAALRSFQTEPGLRVELVAAEPLVESPVAVAFDERGRIFVAENRGYPTGPAAGEPPVGRIALLEDTDGDGRADKRHDFATGLTFPNGVLPWNGGVIVTCAPEVLFLRDTNGDNIADERQVLLTGFSTAGSTQLRVSHPTLSPDNWVYVTSGLTGGKIFAPGKEEQAVSIQRTDLRFRPDGSQWEAADGGAQFGITFDDFGRRFICYNRVQVQHVVLPSRVLRRHPQLAFAETVQNCPAETVAEPLKGHGAAARLFPISDNVTTADSHAGTFTAACAVTVFRGTGLPEAYRGGAFSCDPTANLVHFDRLVQKGASFAALRSSNEREFLASTDSWFRPVFLANGPDGALYVCDMYRKTIEHPDYLPVEIRKHTDFETGKNLGRIWRVVRDDRPSQEWPARREVKLNDATTAELITTLLTHPDAWRRETAQRLLLERRPADAADMLRTRLVEKEVSPAGLVPGLHLLATLGDVDDALLAELLVHPAAPVRETALLMIEPRVPGNVAWLAKLLPLAHDDDPRVRFQLAITLGAHPADNDAQREQAICAALAFIAARDGDDRWLRVAVLSSLAQRERPFLQALLDVPTESPLSTDLLTELGRLAGQSLPEAEWSHVVPIAGKLQAKSSLATAAALLAGFAEGVQGRVKLAAEETLWSKVVAAGEDRPATQAALDQLLASSSAAALDDQQHLPDRLAALKLLGWSSPDQAGERLAVLVEPQQPVALQSAVVRTWGRLRDERLAAVLLSPARFAAYTPALREEVLAVLIAEPTYLPGLLTSLESGEVSPTVIDALRRQQLTQHRDVAIRERAAKLFGAVMGDRARVYEEYKSVVDLPAQASAGVAVFKRVCATCHRLDREGFAVGPDLFGIRNQPKSAILLHIVVPDQEITAGFAAYTAIMTDGRSLTGLVVAESPTTVTLRLPQGKEESLLRTEIEELIASKLSLMPQGLEKSITRQEFADLLAYLKGEQ